jgi:hypothetical protein
MNGRPGHPYGPDEIDLGNDDSPVTGSVTFNRCHVDSSDWTAVFVRKPATGYSAVFNDCAFTNVSQQQVPYNMPLAAEVSNYVDPCAGFGGVSFNNCLLTYVTEFPFFQGFGWSTSPGITDVNFTGTVVAPNSEGLVITNSLDTVNSLFSANEVSAMPPSTVTLTLVSSLAQECGLVPIVFSAERTSDDLSFALPVRYTKSGDVVYGDDVHLLTGSLVIPANGTSQLDSVVARWDDLVEAPESVTLTPMITNWYTLSGEEPLDLLVYDCLQTGGEEVVQLAPLVAWPNPFTDRFLVRAANGSAPVEVIDASGTRVFRGPLASVDARPWPPGFYVLLGFSDPVRLMKQ